MGRAMAQEAGAATPRVLVVEDNYLMAEVICDFVRACGFQPVGPASTVEGGVRLAREEEIDAAILDINLQGRLCFPICSALAQKHVPFIFLSGYATTLLVPSEFRAVRHIEKPFAAEEFESILQELIGRCGRSIAAPLAAPQILT